MKTIRLIAPAKTNLYLGVGQRRDDGFHEVTTVMHALTMHDTLTMTHLGAGEHAVLLEPCDEAQPMRECPIDVEEGSGLLVDTKILWASDIEPIEVASDANLATRAVNLLAKNLGRNVDEFIRIVIDKHIPSQAGLGGGSSDAAAAILGAASFWGVSADDPKVEQTAAAIGADVRFFLHGGCALLQGKGERYVRTLKPMKDSVTLIRPSVGVSTAEAYEVFDRAPAYPESDIIEAVNAAVEATEVPLYNNMEIPAESLLDAFGEIREVAAAQAGVRDVLLCGSGSAVMAVCDDYASAQALSAIMQARGFWARVTSFSSIRAALMPDK